MQKDLELFTVQRLFPYSNDTKAIPVTQNVWYTSDKYSGSGLNFNTFFIYY